MLPIISGREGDQIKVEVTVDISGSMLEAEESILRAVNWPHPSSISLSGWSGFTTGHW
jgi:hypothetical protein